MATIKQVFALIAEHGLRKMEQREYDAFAGIAGEGYILEVDQVGDVATIVIDASDNDLVVQAFDGEGNGVLHVVGVAA